MVDTAIERAVDDDCPAIFAFGHFHDGDALHVLQDLYVVERLRHAFRRMRQVGFVVDVFVVDRDHLGAADDEEFHAVGVLTENLVGILKRHTLHRIDVGSRGEQGLTPTGKRLPVVAFRHMDGVVGRNVDRLEGEARSGFLCLSRGRAQQVADGAHGNGSRTHCQHAKKAAARDGAFDDTVEVGHGRRRIVQLVPLVPGEMVGVGVGHGRASFG